EFLDVILCGVEEVCFKDAILIKKHKLRLPPSEKKVFYESNNSKVWQQIDIINLSEALSDTNVNHLMLPFMVDNMIVPKCIQTLEIYDEQNFSTDVICAKNPKLTISLRNKKPSIMYLSHS